MGDAVIQDVLQDVFFGVAWHVLPSPCQTRWLKVVVFTIAVHLGSTMPPKRGTVSGPGHDEHDSVEIVSENYWRPPAS